MHSPGEFQKHAPSVDDHTRASLLARVRDWNDDASWREFFETYWRLIYSLAIKTGLSESEAEEVAQATMISVADAIRDFKYNRETGSFKQWLCGQAKWKIHDHLRRNRREQKVFLQNHQTLTATGTGTVSSFPEAANDYAAYVESDWHEALRQTALTRVKTLVKPKHFQIFDLYALKQWPLRRISRTLGVSIPQVYLIKSRVARLLRKQTRDLGDQVDRVSSSVFLNRNHKTHTV
ncbi:MAG TPA: sigma-70 family RNA polymerase sigma factor [Candidatus Limnocylindria bacterium]|nr:sigma-70 family RNA polymerase sigma factor [Candidatus Limnocylindria bacterium]